MTQEIKLSGIAAIPDDYQSPDGQLDASLNLINENGAVRAIQKPRIIRQFEPGMVVLTIHSTQEYSHYIIYNENDRSLYWLNRNASIPEDPVQIGHISAPPLKVAAIGNTLAVVADGNSPMQYFHWKDDNYRWLGSKPPFLNIIFATGEQHNESYGVDDDYSIYLETSVPGASGISRIENENTVYFKDEYQASFTESVWAVVNKANKIITDNNRFYAPFFVRYCYTLFDGSHVMHSAPVFMPVSMAQAFRVELMNYPVASDGEIEVSNNYKYCVGHNTSRKINLGYMLLKYVPADVPLVYRCDDTYTLNTLIGDWSDIVTSIDVFVSLPILREDNSRPVISASRYSAGYTYEVRELHPYSQINVTYRDLADTYDIDFGERIICDIPMFNDDQYAEKILNTVSFFKIASFDLGKDNPLNLEEWTDVPMDNGTLATLATREAMVDDYNTHNALLAAYDTNGNATTNLFVFNSRLLVSSVRERLFNGFMTTSLVPYEANHLVRVYGCAVFINTTQGQKVVINRVESIVSEFMLANMPLFYPDSRAVKMVIRYRRSGDSTDKYAVLPMKSSAFLNGSFTTPHLVTDLDKTAYLPEDTATIPGEGDNIIISPGKLYTSEVNNPFFFPVTGINTIGNGTILGLATVTEPLSQGQFGYADIYIFSSDGIWVAQINQEGKINNIKPVNKDVCTNPKSITQLGSSVLYVTQRGIMQIYGRNVECISDIIATEHPFNHLSALPKLSTINSNLPSIAPFSEFLSDCRILYDYIHQRIIVFNPLQDEHRHEHQRTIGGLFDPTTGTYTPHFHYAYVFSLRSNLWGMMDSNLAYSLNSYPECLAMDQDNNLVSFDNPATDTPVSSIAITRPIKFGSPDTLKSVYELIQRGVFNRGDVKTILYGSRDLERWYLIASSTSHAIRGLRGTPYKYFRLVAVSSLADNQSLAGTTFVVEPRHIHKLH